MYLLECVLSLILGWVVGCLFYSFRLLLIFLISAATGDAVLGCSDTVNAAG